MFHHADAAREDVVSRVVLEHSDGGRNLLHTAAALCIPTSNKDPGPGRCNIYFFQTNVLRTQ